MIFASAFLQVDGSRYEIAKCLQNLMILKLINYIEGLNFLCLARSWLLFQNIRTIAGAKGNKWSCCTPILVDVDTTKISLPMVTFCVCLFFTPKLKRLL